MTIDMTRRRTLALTAGTAVFGLAGCASSPTQNTDGGGDGHGHTGSIGPATDSAEVAVNTTEDGEQHFEPHAVHVAVDGTVTWRLESGTHTATAYHPDNDQPRLVPEGTTSWDSGMLSEQGETYEHTFETEGVYHYYCLPHETQGMIGSVIVGDPHLDEQPALGAPPADKPEAVQHKIEELNEMTRSAMEDDHEDDGHHNETEDGHHQETEDAHHDETEDGHHQETEDDHHNGTTEHHENETEDHHNDSLAN
ncbi:MAG: plastocyanin/azurin family copper-binding protein [Halapricum sp.]